jgi:adenylosuccinate lyase
MDLSPLTAVAPVDGRYRRLTAALAQYFSEFALIRYRVQVELAYFLELCRLPLPPLAGLDRDHGAALRSLHEDFSETDARRVKQIESVTNHDVKAVEYWLKERFSSLGIAPAQAEFIHFGLTSQDINNTALPLALRDAWRALLRPGYVQAEETLLEMARRWRRVPMLARTHGQPASPTTLGKELAVFAERLAGQLALLDAVPFSAKFGGATGGFNAHVAAYPQVDWPAFADGLIEQRLGLTRIRLTTQIEPYDNLAAFCDGVKRLNTILLDLDRDLWSYVSLGYFRQRIAAAEVGSSAMPHKVNPIDFENSEGNLGVANALLEHLAAKLPVSRLQRDLTDSTVTRTLGVPLAHTRIALASLVKGLGKLMLDEERLRQDLEANWAVVAEGIQTILRREGYPQPFEALKALTRTNAAVTRQTIADFIEQLEVAAHVKQELRALTPHTYIGRCPF